MPLARAIVKADSMVNCLHDYAATHHFRPVAWVAEIQRDSQLVALCPCAQTARFLNKRSCLWQRLLQEERPSLQASMARRVVPVAPLIVHSSQGERATGPSSLSVQQQVSSYEGQQEENAPLERQDTDRQSERPAEPPAAFSVASVLPVFHPLQDLARSAGLTSAFHMVAAALLAGGVIVALVTLIRAAMEALQPSHKKRRRIRLSSAAHLSSDSARPSSTFTRRARLLPDPSLVLTSRKDALRSSACLSEHSLPTSVPSGIPSQTLIEPRASSVSILSVGEGNKFVLPSGVPEDQGTSQKASASRTSLHDSDGLQSLRGDSTAVVGLEGERTMGDGGGEVNVVGVQNRAWREKASAELLRERQGVGNSPALGLSLSSSSQSVSPVLSSPSPLAAVGEATRHTPALPASVSGRRTSAEEDWSGKSQDDKEVKEDVLVGALPDEVLDGDALVGQLSRLEIGDLRTGLFLANNRRRMPRRAGLPSLQDRESSQEEHGNGKIQGNFEDEEDVNQPLLRRVATIWQQMGGGESDDDKEELTAMVRAMRQRTIDREQVILQERGASSKKASPAKEKLLVLQESHEELMEALKGNFRSSGAARAAAALVYQDWELQRVAQGVK